MVIPASAFRRIAFPKAVKTVSGAFQNRSLNIGYPSRHSDNIDLQVTIFGAYGFLGRYVTALLASSGIKCIIPFRGDDMEWRHLKVDGDLGVVVPVPFSPRNDASIARVMKGSDVVINLIGKDYETMYLPWLVNTTFKEVHVDIPAKLGKFALEAGVTNFIHMSALAADPYSTSEWARTKAAGELSLRDVIPGATIIRPADIFGPEDRFLNMLCEAHMQFPRVPIVNGGKALVQPVFCQDVAHAIARIAVSSDPEYMLAQTYELAGPEIYTWKEVVEYIFEVTRSEKREVLNLSPKLAEMIGKAINYMPNPLITHERFKLMNIDNVLDPNSPTKRLHHLGIEANPMEVLAAAYLYRHRTGSQFVEIAEKHL